MNLATLLLGIAAVGSAEPSPRREYLQVALGGIWYEGASRNPTYGTHNTAGLLPVDVMLGVRLTDHLAIGGVGRAGVLHYGAGLEAAYSTAPWGRDGLTIRLAPMFVSDHLLSCATFGDPGPGALLNNCSSATYFLVEAGVHRRWAFGDGHGFSFGLALNAGRQSLDGRSGTASASVYGLTFPRLQVDF